MGTLYLVATPIGNLEDISARALRVLREAALIAAEDTRHSGRLLKHFGIDTPQTSYHEHSQAGRLEHVLAALEGGDVALISDAGTPALNDPGYELVRAALDAGHTVSPIPGPSAPLAALVASGLPTDTFLYLGYLPRRRAQRRSLLETIEELPYTLIFLETPHRLPDALEDMLAVLGNRQIAVARELTKLHEEILRGELRTAQAHFSAFKPRGEFTLVLAGRAADEGQWPEERLNAALDEAQTQDDPPSQIAGQLAAESGWPRREIYRRLLNEKEKRE